MTNGGCYTVNVTNAYLGRLSSVQRVLTVIPVLPCTAPPAGLVSWWRGEGTPMMGLGGNSGTLREERLRRRHGGARPSISTRASARLIVPMRAVCGCEPVTIEAWIIHGAPAPTNRYCFQSKGVTGGDNGYQFVLSGNTLVGQLNSPGKAGLPARIASGAVITTGGVVHVAWT